MAAVKIYHPIDGQNYECIIDGTQCYKLVGEVEVHDEEYFYKYSQNDFNPHYKRFGIRNTSVGDIVEKDDKFYMIRGYGLQEISLEEFQLI